MTQWKTVARQPDTYFFLLLVAVFVAVGVFLALGTDPTAALAVAQWFDPIFFQYNLALTLTAVLIVPFVTFVYTNGMQDEKKHRLEHELDPAERTSAMAKIEEVLGRKLRFRAYAGSTAVMMIVLALGLFIILFLKPAFGTSGPQDGVDYSKGANFLLLGPFIELYRTDTAAVYHHIIVSLTAFQFGFLGAYIYFIGSLVRSYFTLDLSPNTFVDAAIRIAIGSTLSLVLSFIIPLLPYFKDGHGEDLFLRSLPVVAFFIGFFPNRGLLLLQKFGAQALGVGGSKYNATGLSALAGMSHAHEVRLRREGFDNLENLSHADALDLALRTGFGYRQLRHWVGQAWLRVHLGEDYPTFEKTTGITSRDELQKYIAANGTDAVARLSKDLSEPLPGKLDAVRALLGNP